MISKRDLYNVQLSIAMLVYMFPSNYFFPPLIGCRPTYNGGPCIALSDIVFLQSASYRHVYGKHFAKQCWSLNSIGIQLIVNYASLGQLLCSVGTTFPSPRCGIHFLLFFFIWTNDVSIWKKTLKPLQIPSTLYISTFILLKVKPMACILVSRVKIYIWKAAYCRSKMLWI